MRPQLLDLFCGAGGAAMGYHRAGFDVTGVDIKRQPHFPFKFLHLDVFEYLYRASNLTGFDAIHASPPCQLYSEAGKLHRVRQDHPDLIGPTRHALEETGLPWVIENVPNAPLRVDLELCGSMFGLAIRRHRWFEANFPLRKPHAPHNHSALYDPWHGPGRTADKFRAAMGIDWMPIAGGRNKPGSVDLAIPPAYTEWIGKQLLEVVTFSKAG